MPMTKAVQAKDVPEAVVLGGSRTVVGRSAPPCPGHARVEVRQ